MEMNLDTRYKTAHETFILKKYQYIQFLYFIFYTFLAIIIIIELFFLTLILYYIYVISIYVHKYILIKNILYMRISIINSFDNVYFILYYSYEEESYKIINGI